VDFHRLPRIVSPLVVSLALLSLPACGDERDEGDDASTGLMTSIGDSAETGGDGEIYDVSPDTGGGGCEEGMGGGGNDGVKEFSYIWISNSAEATVSKIDTREGIEVARYKTSSSSGGNPSRTRGGSRNSDSLLRWTPRT